MSASEEGSPADGGDAVGDFHRFQSGAIVESAFRDFSQAPAQTGGDEASAGTEGRGPDVCRGIGKAERGQAAAFDEGRCADAVEAGRQMEATQPAAVGEGAVADEADSFGHLHRLQCRTIGECALPDGSDVAWDADGGESDAVGEGAVAQTPDAVAQGDGPDGRLVPEPRADIPAVQGKFLDGAAVEGIGMYEGDKEGDVDFLQSVAIIEGIVVQAPDAVAQGNFPDGGLVGEPRLDVRAVEAEVFEAVAVVEGVILDVGDAAADFNGFQPRTFVEGRLGDCGHVVGNFDGGKRVAPGKGLVTDGGDGIGCAVVGDRSRNHDVAGIPVVSVSVAGDADGAVAVESIENAAGFEVVCEEGRALCEEQCEQEVCQPVMFHVFRCLQGRGSYQYFLWCEFTQYLSCSGWWTDEKKGLAEED